MLIVSGFMGQQSVDRYLSLTFSTSLKEQSHNGTNKQNSPVITPKYCP